MEGPVYGDLLQDGTEGVLSTGSCEVDLEYIGDIKVVGFKIEFDHTIVDILKENTVELLVFRFLRRVKIKILARLCSKGDFNHEYEDVSRDQITEGILESLVGWKGRGYIVEIGTYNNVLERRVLCKYGEEVCEIT